MEAAPVGAFVQALSSPPLGCYAVVCLAGWLLLFHLSARKALRDDKVVHDVHALAVTGLCLAAYVTNLLPEAYVYMFSCTYFIVDTLDAAAGGRWAMLVAHHLPTLILFGSEALFPRMLQLKYASRIMIIEISTPLLTRWRRSRRKSHFVQFMAVFFLVRVVYLSWLATQFEEEIGGWPAKLAYVLPAVNVYWFLQQAKLLVNYRDGDAPADEKKTRSD